MDIKQIRLDIFKQTGKSIDEDDPFFMALVMLAETAIGIEKKNDAALIEMRQVRDEIKDASRIRAIESQRSVSSTLTSSTTTTSNSLQTLVVAVMACGTGLVAQSLHSSFLIAGFGMVVGFLLSQVSLLFVKDEVQLNKLEFSARNIGAWTESDFKRATNGLKLSNRTLAACHDVLVENISIGAAGVLHKVLPAQISAGLKAIRVNELTTRI